MTIDPLNESRSVGRIIITYEIGMDGDLLTGYDTDGDDLSLVTQLGLLRLAEDTAIRQAMESSPSRCPNCDRVAVMPDHDNGGRVCSACGWHSFDEDPPT